LFYTLQHPASLLSTAGSSTLSGSGSCSGSNGPLLAPLPSASATSNTAAAGAPPRSQIEWERLQSRLASARVALAEADAR